MPRARKYQVDLDSTPYYHVYSRCVRRAFLCGQDALTGRDFSHRRDLMEERMTLMASVFTIELCAFALMDNHAHWVVCVDVDRAKDLSEKAVVRRWQRLFSIPEFVTNYLATGEISAPDPVNWIAERRRRLSDLSWYMRVIKEFIARQANEEDGCKGRFWESRFHSKALTDHRALLTAMAYVDLNPVRAGIAETLEASEHTSIRLRCREAKGQHTWKAVPVMPFDDEAPPKRPSLPMRRDDYLQLVDQTGRTLLRGEVTIPKHLHPIIERLSHDPSSWLRSIKLLGTYRHTVIGSADSLRRWAARIGQQWLHGVSACREVFGNHTG